MESNGSVKNLNSNCHHSRNRAFRYSFLRDFFPWKTLNILGIIGNIEKLGTSTSFGTKPDIFQLVLCQYLKDCVRSRMTKKAIINHFQMKVVCCFAITPIRNDLLLVPNNSESITVLHNSNKVTEPKTFKKPVKKHQTIGIVRG